MWVEAIFAKSDLERALSDFCPLRIDLDKGGSVQMSNPRDIELVEDVGLRLKVTIDVHWPVLGIQVPVSVRSATVEIRPEILKRPGGDRLSFKFRVDDVDVSILPALFDRGIVDRINKELEAKHVELSWNFLETLSHSFELPAGLASARAIALCARCGRVKISSEAFVFAVSFEARVEPRHVAPSLPQAPIVCEEPLET